MDDLFDIAHADALDMSIEEDKAFLINRRKNDQSLYTAERAADKASHRSTQTDDEDESTSKTSHWKKFSDLSLCLRIIFIICDQGTTNRAAIESLVTDARRMYTSNGQEQKRRIIINESEIGPLYNVPHLLKGIRNNLLKKIYFG